MAVIVARHLTKKFKDLVAVDDLSLEIEEGECFGLLGPNGAGKTSLIRMIIAISPPTRGNIWVQGKDLKVYPRQVKAILGVVPQIDNLDEDLTVLQNLTTFARYFAIPRDEAHRRSLELLKFFKLEEKHHSRIRELSGGMKRLLLLARGLINQPEIMVLDEPTIGLDPQTKHLVWQKLGELKAQGVTQLLCTQNMEEAAILCDRVTVMHLGKILVQDSPQALLDQYVGDEVLGIEVNSGNRGEITEELASGGFEFVDVGDTIQVFHVSRDELARGLKNLPERLIQRPTTLEDVFFRLWHSEAPGIVFEPILILLAMDLGLGAYVGLIGGQKYIEFVAPGIMASYAMFAASFECTYGSFFRMEERRTYDAIIATPLTVEDVIAGEIFWGATRSVITGSVVLAVAAAFQLVHSPWALLIPVVAFLGGVLFASIAILFTSLIPSFYEFNYFFTLFITPMFFFSGVFFPLTSFPEIVQTISWIIPLTPVVKLIRALVWGEFHPDLLLALAIIIVLSILFFSISMVTMRRRLTV